MIRVIDLIGAVWGVIMIRAKFANNMGIIIFSSYGPTKMIWEIQNQYFSLNWRYLVSEDLSTNDLKMELFPQLRV